ncbi:hypothetical protein M3Y97_01058300 [Aphelenchoides bicaudatus]|nr:hypothetical protein M3Y97_01058300 [Aphelenchoides bicaudatus]
MEREQLRQFVRQQLKEGQSRQETFLEACRRTRNGEEVDKEKAYGLFENFDKKRNNQSYMDHPYRLEFGTVNEEWQKLRTGIASWSTERPPNSKFYWGKPKFINSRFVMFSKTNKENNDLYLSVVDTFHGEQKEIKVQHISFPLYSLIGFEFIDSKRILMTMSYSENGKSYWTLNLMDVDFQASTCKAIDSKRFSGNEIYATLYMESKRRRFMLHVSKERKNWFQIGEIKDDHLELDERPMEIDLLPGHNTMFERNNPHGSHFYEFQIDVEQAKLKPKFLYAAPNMMVPVYANDYYYINGDLIYYPPRRFRNQGLCSIRSFNVKTQEEKQLDGEYAVDEVIRMHMESSGILQMICERIFDRGYEVHRLKMGKLDKLSNLAFFTIKEHFLFDKQSPVYKETISKLPGRFQPLCFNF